MEQPKPLGRGLEQISQVFLTQGGAEKVPDARSRRPEPRSRPREEPAAGPLVLRPVADVTRAQLAEAVQACSGALEDGLRIIDSEILCPPCGEIDFLAVDRMNQLAAIDFDTAPGDELLIRGLGHFDWIVGNVANLRRMFRGQTINFSLQPRLLLLSPQFSARVRCAGRQIASPEIEWIRYHLVEAPGQVGVFFERLPPMD
jgi:hypothetical protein